MILRGAIEERLEEELMRAEQVRQEKEREKKLVRFQLRVMSKNCRWNDENEQMGDGWMDGRLV